MTRPELQLAEPGAKHLALGLALLFLGKQEASEATLEVLKTVDERISQYAQVRLVAIDPQ